MNKFPQLLPTAWQKNNSNSKIAILAWPFRKFFVCIFWLVAFSFWRRLLLLSHCEDFPLERFSQTELKVSAQCKCLETRRILRSEYSATSDGFDLEIPITDPLFFNSVLHVPKKQYFSMGEEFIIFKNTNKVFWGWKALIISIFDCLSPEFIPKCNCCPFYRSRHHHS